MKALTPRRRTVLLLLAVVVGGMHGWLARLLPDAHLGEGSADRMPKRIEVAYVSELAPVAPPVVAPRPKAQPRRAAVAAPAASAPVVEAAAPIIEPPAAIVEPAAPAAAAGTPVAAEAAESPASAAVAALPAALPASSAASAAAAFEWPPSTKLSYRLTGYYHGDVLGGAQVEWLRSGSRYQVHLDVYIGAQATPLVARRMSSDGELTEQGLVPRRYDEETTALLRQVRRRTIVFDGERVLLPNGKIGERVPGMQDAASQFVQLTWLFTLQPELLEAGRSIQVPLALPTNVDRWAYDAMGPVMLATPFGPLQAFHMKPRRELRPGRDLVVDIWFAPSLQYLPVRLLVRQDEQTYVDMQLDQLPQQATR